MRTHYRLMAVSEDAAGFLRFTQVARSASPARMRKIAGDIHPSDVGDYKVFVETGDIDAYGVRDTEQFWLEEWLSEVTP